MLIVIGALLLVGLVVLHELGHFIAAKRSGVDVEEFGIGFPPKAKSLGKKDGTEFTLNWLPLGGFVRLKGENDSATEKGSYGAAKLSDKVKIITAGVVVNALLAVVLLTIVSFVGLPKVLDNQFTVSSDETLVTDEVVAAFVADDSPASSAGLYDGDTLVSIRATVCEGCDQTSETIYFNDADQLGLITESFAGQEVEIAYIDNDDKQEKLAVLTLNDEATVEQSRLEREQCIEGGGTDCPATKGYLGVIPSDYEEVRYTWSAPIVAAGFSVQVVGETLVVFGNIITDLFRGDTTTAQENAVGVVGIGYILGQISSQGFISVLFLVGIISISLALMNILPIPALDGGRLFVTLVFRVIDKPLTKELEERIHGTGFAVLMVLFLLITVVDVQRFIL